MSRWSDNFDNHGIHEVLRQSSEWLEVDVDDTDGDFEEERRRLTKIVDTLQQVVSGLDAEFFPQQWLDQINQHLTHPNFHNQLLSYSQNPNLANLQTANNHITQFAPQIYQLAAMARPIESNKIIKKAEAAFTSFTTSINANVKKIDDQVDQTEERLATISAESLELSRTLEALSATADEKMSQWQADFTAKQTTRAEDYSSAQIEREEKFEGLLAEWKQDIEASSAEIKHTQANELAETQAKFKDSGEEILGDMREKHQSVLEIHQLVGRDSVAGGYQKSAGEERQAANLWRKISMVALTLAAIWLGTKYWIGFGKTNSSALNWPEIITASSLTAVLLITAGYASRQSKLHRDSEKKMRSYALETKALDPFMANLDVEDQKKIKAELIRRMFGQQHTQTPDRPVNIDEGVVKTVVESFLETASKTVGKIVDRT